MLARTREAPPHRMIRPKVPFLVRRSKLLVSPLDAASMAAAAQSGADAVALDLGYAASSAQQPAARLALPHAVQRLAAYGADVLAWVDVATAADDVEACALPGVVGIIAQVSRQEDVAELDALLTAAERSLGLPHGRFDLELVLASAQAVLDAELLAQASPRVVALSLDEEGVLADMGVEPSDDPDPLLYARGRTVVAARVAGVQVHGVLLLCGDGPLAERVRRVRLQGLRGALCTDPAAVPALNEGFAPSPAEVEQAHRVKEAVEAAVQGGHGAVALADGTVADMATFRHSQAVLEWAAAVRAREAAKGLPSPA